MLILEALNNPAQFVALIAALVIGLTFHEFAHAWVANRLGDPTAAELGRLTLDPRRHIDPLGALVFLIVGFGWAKPVPINPYRLSRREILLVALAGPVTNIALATLAAALLWSARLLPAGAAEVASGALVFFLYLNVILAVFNMLPVPPLDGWKVAMGLVPEATAMRMRTFEYGPGQAALLILIVVSRFLPGNLDPIRFLIERPASMIVAALTWLGGAR